MNFMSRENYKIEIINRAGNNLFSCSFFVDNYSQVLYTLTVLIVLIQLERRRDHDFD